MQCSERCQERNACKCGFVFAKVSDSVGKCKIIGSSGGKCMPCDIVSTTHFIYRNVLSQTDSSVKCSAKSRLVKPEACPGGQYVSLADAFNAATSNTQTTVLNYPKYSSICKNCLPYYWTPPKKRTCTPALPHTRWKTTNSNHLKWTQATFTYRYTDCERACLDSTTCSAYDYDPRAASCRLMVLTNTRRAALNKVGTKKYFSIFTVKCPPPGGTGSSRKGG